MKTIKMKIISVFLSAVMLLGIIPMNAFAAGLPSYVALGDSISTGYGLEDYTVGTVPTNSFSHLIADEMGYDLTNLAVDGNTAPGILAQLSSEAVQTAVRNADLITITCGGNDLMGALYQSVADDYNERHNTNFVGQDVMNEFADGSSTEMSFGLVDLGSAAQIVSNFSESDSFNNALQSYVTSMFGNTGSVISTISALNPDATVIVTTQYNPYTVFTGGSMYSFLNDGIESGVQVLNAAIKNNANGKYIAADVYENFSASSSNLCNAQEGNLDFHPNAAGHAVIAQTIAAVIPNEVPEKTNVNIILMLIEGTDKESLDNATPINFEISPVIPGAEGISLPGDIVPESIELDDMTLIFCGFISYTYDEITEPETVSLTDTVHIPQEPEYGTDEWDEWAVKYADGVYAAYMAHEHDHDTSEWKYDTSNHWHECECGDKTDVSAHGELVWAYDDAVHWQKCNTCGYSSMSVEEHLYDNDTDTECNSCEYIRTVTVQTFTVKYTDGVEDEEAFADQIISDLTDGTETPEFDGTPTREGYIFIGWTPDLAETVTEDVIYVAQWEEALSVTVSDDNPVWYSTITVTTNKPAELTVTTDVEELLEIIKISDTSWNVTFGNGPENTIYTFTATAGNETASCSVTLEQGVAAPEGDLTVPIIPPSFSEEVDPIGTVTIVPTEFVPAGSYLVGESLRAAKTVEVLAHGWLDIGYSSDTDSEELQSGWRLEGDTWVYFDGVNRNKIRQDDIDRYNIYVDDSENPDLIGKPIAGTSMTYKRGYNYRYDIFYASDIGLFSSNGNPVGLAEETRVQFRLNSSRLGHPDPSNMVAVHIDPQSNDVDLSDPAVSADGIVSLSLSVDSLSPFLVVAITEIPHEDEPDAGFGYDYWYWMLLMSQNQEFEIEATASEGGTITPEGISKVKRGNNITYKIESNEGYNVADVIVDGVSIGIVSEYTFTHVGREHTIEAVFEKISWDNPFSDVDENDWFYEDVKFVYENALMLGNNAEGTLFDPDEALSRAMLVTILWRMEGCPDADPEMPYTDVDEDEWYADAIRWAAEVGIVLGYGDGTFGPDDTLTREQLAAMLYRYEQYLGGGFNEMWMFRLSFDDAQNVAEWAYEGVCWLTMKDIYVTRDGNLQPAEDATRAETAAFLRRFCEYRMEQEDK